MERIEFRAVPATEGDASHVSVDVDGAWFRAVPYAEEGPNKLLVNLPLHAAKEALAQLADAVAALEAEARTQTSP